MVRQVRILRNIILIAILCSVMLWLARHLLVGQWRTAVLAAVAGMGYGWFYWHHIARRIVRTGRRYEANKVFVRFISIFEIILLATIASPYVLVLLALIILPGLFLDWPVMQWWAVVLGSFGAAGAAVLIWRIVRYEHAWGPVYYQYDSRAWGGGEELLYQEGTVTETLAPRGRVLVNGELWQAVALDEANIPAGDAVEVISRDGLTLYVARISHAST